MIFKYIVTETGCKIFAPSISHLTESFGFTVIGAGFVKFTIDTSVMSGVNGKIKVECFGGSESLEIESRGLKDAKVIELWGQILTNNLSKGFRNE